MIYPMVILRAGKNYNAYCPDVAGLLVTDNKIDAIRKRMKRALQSHLQGLSDDGLPVPKSSIDVQDSSFLAISSVTVDEPKSIKKKRGKLVSEHALTKGIRIFLKDAELDRNTSKKIGVERSSKDIVKHLNTIWKGRKA